LNYTAYYIIFLSFDNPNTPEGVDDSVSNPMPSPTESVLAMFLMSMTNFGDYYGAFERTEHEFEAKVKYELTFKYFFLWIYTYACMFFFFTVM
jgi:hypothetical protein